MKKLNAKIHRRIKTVFQRNNAYFITDNLRKRRGKILDNFILSNPDINKNKSHLSYTLKKRLKITQLEKVRFIKMNELKLTQVKLFLAFSLYVCCC